MENVVIGLSKVSTHIHSVLHLLFGDTLKNRAA